MTNLLRIALRTAAAAALASPVLAAPSFNRDVRPILSDNCYACHGPDEQERKGGLRLDVREAALKGGDSGPAIVPGKAAESLLLQRLTTHDADEIMPPAKTGKKLTAQQIATLQEWIASGAGYEGHWAFQPPVRPEPPENGAGSAIDAFVLAKLKAAGLSPAPAAAKETLIRRVTLDLTGLPPTLAEVDAFLADESPQAYEKLVDRLLASPRYGEQMAQQWLDFARYADSNGFQSDTSRQMWPWREWLIGALNRNMPFDQFTVEQLAGDMLPEATAQQILATGFHRNHRLNGEGGRIVEEWFAETVIDRVETTGLTWLGLTMNCCRCHDHKYDPISQKEFYQFFAYFNSIDEQGVMDEFGGAAGTRKGGNSAPVLDLPTPEQEREIAEAKQDIGEAEAALASLKKTAPERQPAWEAALLKDAQAGTPAWTPLQQETATSAGGATLTRQPDGSWLASGPNPANDVYTITVPFPAGELSGIRLEVFPDASLPNQSLGRYDNGNFVLSGVEARLTAKALPKPVTLSFARAEAAYEQQGWPVKNVLAGSGKRGKKTKNTTGWAVDGNSRREPNRAMFLAAAPVTAPEDAKLTITLRHDALTGHNIGRFRLSTTALPAGLVNLGGNGISPSVREALLTEVTKRTKAQTQELAKLFAAAGDDAVKAAEADLAAAKQALAAVDADISSVMVMRERAQPRDAFVLTRGEYDKPAAKVERAVPAALPPLPAGEPNNRLGLARWLVSGSHPLTARVWVNRAWERFFGTGLVKSSENFGSQADWPSHPELLDWLATEFVRLKWDMKAMHKTIVMSATYQQSPQVSPQALAQDPENRLLSRGSRLRLSAEGLRDQALSLSGLLVEKLGGPSVRPYMPEGVWDETSVYGDMRGYKPDSGENLYRRSLYTIWKRTAAPPSMLLFDSPNREICTVKRGRTNTPLQALALLNEITFVEAARTLGQRMIREGGTPQERIAWAFRHVTSRRPTDAELAVLVQGLVKKQARFAQFPAEAAKLITVGASLPDPAISPAELAACTATANVLLNLDEVITRE